MPPLDVQLVVYNRVWELLEDSDSFCSIFQDGNRLKSTAARISDRDKAKSGPGDYPKIRIDVAEETDNERAPRTFGMSRTDYAAKTCDYGIPIALNFIIKIVHDSTILGTQTAAEAAVRGAILANGTNLGIAWIGNSILRGSVRREENSVDTGGALRTISRIKLVVSARPKLSALTDNATYI